MVFLRLILVESKIFVKKDIALSFFWWYAILLRRNLTFMNESDTVWGKNE